LPKKKRPLIIIDAQNIAMRYGSNKTFKVQGIKIVADFFLRQGHTVIGFIPDYLVSQERILAKKKLNAMSMNSSQKNFA